MTNREFTAGGLEVVRDPAVIAHLTIGKPNTDGSRIGPGYEFGSPAEAEAVARAAGEHTAPFTITDAAFCIDERAIMQLGDITDPNILRQIVAPRLPGGTFLAATKAAVAANAVYLRGSQDFNEAYSRTAQVLAAAGYKDAAHAGCGAENNAVASVEEQVDANTAFSTLRAVGVAHPDDADAFGRMYEHKEELVQKGFYAAFTPAEHAARVQQTAPQYFAQLQAAHDTTHGHHARGIYLPQAGMGLANGFSEATGSQLFVYTHDFASKLAQALSGNEEEAHMIELAFGYDLLDVSNTLIAAPQGQPDQPGYYPGLAVLQPQLAFAA